MINDQEKTHTHTKQTLTTKFKNSLRLYICLFRFNSLNTKSWKSTHFLIEKKKKKGIRSVPWNEMWKSDLPNKPPTQQFLGNLIIMPGSTVNMGKQIKKNYSYAKLITLKSVRGPTTCLAMLALNGEIIFCFLRVHCLLHLLHHPNGH